MGENCHSFKLVFLRQTFFAIKVNLKWVVYIIIKWRHTNMLYTWLEIKINKLKSNLISLWWRYSVHQLKVITTFRRLCSSIEVITNLWMHCSSIKVITTFWRPCSSIKIITNLWRPCSLISSMIFFCFVPSFIYFVSFFSLKICTEYWLCSRCCMFIHSKIYGS